MYTCTQMYTYAHTQTHAYTRTYMRTFTCILMYVRVHTHSVPHSVALALQTLNFDPLIGQAYAEGYSLAQLYGGKKPQALVSHATMRVISRGQSVVSE